MNRYLVTIQHEVIIYAKDDRGVKRTITDNPQMRLRNNLQVVSIKQILHVEEEPPREIIDCRTAPGS